MYKLTLSGLARGRDRCTGFFRKAICFIAGVPLAAAITWCAGVAFSAVLWWTGVFKEAWSTAQPQTQLSPSLTFLKYFMAFFSLGLWLFIALLFLASLLGTGYEMTARETAGPFRSLLVFLSQLFLFSALCILMLRTLIPALASGIGLLLSSGDTTSRCNGTLYEATFQACNNYTYACPCAHEGALPLAMLTLFCVVTGLLAGTWSERKKGDLDW